MGGEGVEKDEWGGGKDINNNANPCLTVYIVSRI